MAITSGIMEGRVGLLFLFLLCGTWACDGRQLVVPELTVISDLSVMQVNNQKRNTEILASEDISRKGNVCTFCEEFATQALNYLAQNKTQKEIVDMLHLTCSRISSFEKECITLVDYYAPIFFLEVSSVQPGDFCQKVNLCQHMKINLQFQDNKCGICRLAVAEMLAKLKNPDTQLDIIQDLLKLCNTVDKYLKKCKKLVFEYGPLILVNAERFLETKDICTVFHACARPCGWPCASDRPSTLAEVSSI